MANASTPTPREDLNTENLSTYVAELQLHMTLQARKLVPNLKGSDRTSSSRVQLLHETQAHLEKLASRQVL